jgi:hypothetical protein
MGGLKETSREILIDIVELNMWLYFIILAIILAGFYYISKDWKR